MDMNVDISLPFHQCHYCDSLFLLIPVDECHLQMRVELYHTYRTDGTQMNACHILQEAYPLGRMVGES